MRSRTGRFCGDSIRPLLLLDPHRKGQANPSPREDSRCASPDCRKPIATRPLLSVPRES
jgi:hypothetical protein